MAATETTTTSIFEEATSTKSQQGKPINDDQEEEEEKKDQLYSDNSNNVETYPPNSLNAAKSKWVKNKHREQHKYEHGEKRKKTQTQKFIAKVVSQVDKTIQETGDKLLNATDDAVSKLSKSTGIQFAPVNIPLKRRRQTFAILLWSLIFPLSLILNFVAFRYWTGWKFYAYIAFIGWKIMYQTFHKDGGLPIPWFRNAVIWKWFTDFFPIRLHKLSDLDDTGETSYLFGYHPHGIIGLGAIGTFGMMTSGFHKLFPGVDVRLLTLTINFRIPFQDLFLTFMGLCDASRESCNAILGDEEEHKSLCLVLGGAKESLEANPGVVKLYLKNRKGFVKVALENGATLVPVFGFGENELFEQVENPEGSFLRKIQNQLQRRLGFAIPLFHGRGIFQYNFGLLPKRHPIDVVFGKPIKCPKMTKETITPQIIDEFHTQYCNELKSLFDQEKSKYYGDKDKLPEMIFT